MFTITIDGDVRLFKRLDAAIEAVGSPKAALEDIADVMLEEIGRNFKAEGARLNPEKWVTLTRDTIRARVREGFSAGPILHRTGNLSDSFVAEVSDELVRVFSTSELFAYHQLGQGNNPKRRMLAFSERLKQEIIGVFTKFIHEALEARKLPVWRP